VNDVDVNDADLPILISGLSGPRRARESELAAQANRTGARMTRSACPVQPFFKAQPA